MQPPSRSYGRLLAPALVFLICAGVYVATLGERLEGTSENPHFVSLADSYLHGQLSVRGKPPSNNDWARYEGKVYVSFPPFPAIVIMPLVAVWGMATWDSLFWAIFAGLGPALLYVLLRRLRELGESERTPRDDLLLTVLFAFGSAYYYVAVQGTVWFAAHVVAVALIALYTLFALRAERPLWAGVMLGLLFMTRATTPLLGFFFAIEALRVSRRADMPAPESLMAAVRGLDVRAFMRRALVFAVPPLLALGLTLYLNHARFDDPLQTGYELLEIRWRGRIEKWGLFNYHYLAKNLAVMWTSLPWITAFPPYVQISRHGLALWVTTPALLYVLWPKRKSLTMFGLALAAFAVAFVNLLYQNTGWVQFGYRFSLDYAVLLFALIALGGRRLGWRFVVLLVLAIAVNLFGAITFDRAHEFYDRDTTQKVLFQPD
jgi:hypothetical protein